MSAIASAFKTMAIVRAAAPKPAAARQFARAPSALVAIAPNRHRAFRASVAAKAAYGKDEKGDYPSLDYRIFFKDGEKAISPWHDVPLYNADGTCNFICEIPKETKAKMEVATDEPLTPIKQDTKKGKLRDYPYNINWNYGMLPRTWEDPGHEHPEMKVMGDNDPVDVVEIGSAQREMGSVVPVKPVGVYAMIDDGELDWKVIAIAADDPKAKDVNDVADVEKHFPGELEKIRVWFRDYKTPDGKPQNAFGLDDECMDKAYTMAVIEETSGFYDKLKSGARENDKGLSLE
uniref:inorganic diphosphatase n=1 Tax=Micromonas pusilla TaxID=38833 RepID=A0A7R9TQC2_MICPS